MSNGPALTTDDLRTIVQRLNPNTPAGSSGKAMPRIARDSSAVRQLKTHVTADPMAKILLTGHIGGGKSTELLHLAKEKKNDRHVIRCSVLDTLGAQNLDVFTLLLVVLDATVRSWTKHFGAMPPGLVEELVEHFRKLVPEDKRPPELPRTPTNPLFAHLDTWGVVMKALDLRRIRTREALSDFYSDCIRRLSLRYVPEIELASIDISAIVQSCEVVLKELADVAGKPVLLLMDDLDKVRDEKAQESVFIDRAMAWLRLPCAVVATLPYDAFFGARSAEMEDIWGDVLVLDPLPVPEIEGESLKEKALSFYLSMLREAGAEKLISARQNRRLARASGGLPRMFVTFCNTCALYALEAGEDHVRNYHLELVIQDKAKAMRGRLSDEDYEAIVHVLDTEGSNVRKASQALRDGILIRDESQPLEKQFRLADWAEPLIESYRLRQSQKSQ